MFNNLTEHLRKILNKVSNSGRITQKNIYDTLREVRTALLEADVSLPVVKKFIKNVEIKAIGKELNNTLTPGQEFIKIVQKELIFCMQSKNQNLNLSSSIPSIILLVGLQGMGKTTTSAKLGKYIKEKNKKKILITSLDIYRPAAIEQLQILSNQIKIDFFLPLKNKKPIEIAQSAIKYSKKNNYEVVIIDTAGRLHDNVVMMNELNDIYQSISPIETLLIIDAMVGQDANNITNQFKQYIDLTGIIITKTDGNSRAGVALSVREMTGKPIKFIGSGEKINAIELFDPEKIAKRILGMDDVVSIIEEIENKITDKQSKNLSKTINSNKNFDLNDFLMHIQELKKIGGLSSFINRLPNNNFFNNSNKSSIDDKTLKKFSAIIYSMNEKEKKNPNIIKFSRKKRIALGSGVHIQDINIMLKQFLYLQKIMKKVKKGNIKSIFENLKNIFLK
ncbi:Signal recognition particle protein [Buchnera aphidicola (Thelaxes suberi)]|uniref:signal recognition particle protein n=1 Tax=Buchnera aphidicola TaxID=9 RepID=UPI0034646710